MPQLILLVITLFIIAWVIAAFIFVIQWIGAVLLLGLQVIILPFLIYLLPSFIAILALMAFLYGSFLAWRSYVQQLNIQIASEGQQSKIINSIVKFILMIVLVTSYLASCIGFLYFTVPLFIEFQVTMFNYFEQIHFPAYRIVFPFWRQ